MSSSLVKGKLKASREAIQSKDWDKAENEARQALEYEADNYNAQVFRALALLHLERFDESEEAYQKATRLQPSQLLAWQGLDKFYFERKAWDKQAQILQKLLDLAFESDEPSRCAEALQRLVALQREHSAGSQIAAALALYLPDSKYHSLLSKLPSPDQTNPKATTTFEAEMAIHVQSLSIVEEMITLTEEYEANIVDREVEKRRTRLDSASKTREALRNEIGVEVWRVSKLPELYEQVLSHIDASDEIRREAEHKLLAYRYKFLRALPNPSAKIAGPGSTAAKEDVAEKERMQVEEKHKALEAVKSLASGIVAINVADELAWTTTLEWQNVFSPVEWKRHELRAFIDHFPRSGLCSSLKALLYTIQDEQFIKEEKERFEAMDVDVAKPDPLSLAIVGIEEAPSSVIAHRIASCLYLLDRDWLSCSDMATSGLELAKRLEVAFAVDLTMVKAGLECSLGTALTHLYPPQYHTRALRLADLVLLNEPTSIDATLCKAYIAQTASRWDQARTLFASIDDMRGDPSMSEREEALQKLSISQNSAREARLEVAWCNVKLGRLEEGKEQLEQVIDELDASPTSNSEDLAKAWWRLGSCLWEMGGSHREETSQAFTCFITALKRDSSFAPAFTSLGLYYSNVSKPPDPARATKCFQKAFELDAKESEAAHRLAQSYAEDDDWDLVYLVAQRTIEGEGGGAALGGEVTSQRKHVTRNSWAWTAIGSTELVRENFEKAIVAFQIALRSFAEDGDIWMRLGEAYTASGRFTAGIKTFEKALQLLKGTNDEWQPRFSIANVQRQQAKYEEALEILQELCEREPDRLGIRTTCAETRLYLALDEIKQGYTARGQDSILVAMKEARQVLQRDEQILAAWKILADSFFHCDSLCLTVEASVLEDMSRELIQLSAKYNVDVGLPCISAVTLETLKTSPSNSKLLLMSVYLNKLRVLLHYNDEQVAGCAWMDLGVALHRLMIEKKNQQDQEQAKECQVQAIACAKEALKMEPGNGSYWSAMGNLVFNTSVKLAQHCYIKAIESDARIALPWTNLGFLYLKNDDVALAKECFVKAQTLDSDQVQAWIGHAMVAKKQNNDSLCRSLFQHAYAVQQGVELEVAYGFASSLFQSILSGNEKVPASQLYSASFALSSYLSQRPDDVSALHLSALYSERLGELETAIERIERASNILESQYERDESAEKAQLFAVCMVNLGRIRMANGDYEGAKEAFDMGLGLLVAEEEQAESDTKEGVALFLLDMDLKRAQMGAHLGGGIALFALGKEQEAVEALQQALEEISEEDIESKEQLYLLLAKVLWNSGEEQEAERLVMEVISLHPKSIPALIILGAMSVCRGNTQQLGFVQSELKDLMLQKTDTKDQINFFLTCLQLGEGHIQEAIETLHLDSDSSMASRLELVRLLLQVSIDSRLEKGESNESGNKNETLSQAKQEGFSLLANVQVNLAELGQDYLVPTIRLLAIATALEGSKAESLEMAMRLVSLSPDHLPHWTLLKTIQSIP